MERNALIAIVLSLLVLIAFQYLAPKKPVPRQEPQPGQPVQAEPSPPAAEKAPPPREFEEAAPAMEEKTVRVETELYRAEFSSRGGTVRNWELKQYMDEKQEHNVKLLKPGGIYPALALGVQDDFSLSEVNFTVKGGDLRLDENNPSGTVAFESSTPRYSIRRTYTFYHDSYHFEVEDQVEGLREYQVTLGADFGIFNRESSRYSHVGPVVLKDIKRKEIKAGKLEGAELFTGNLEWIALEDKYFFAAIAPVEPMATAKVWKYQDSAAVSFIGEPGTHKLLVYAGPKVIDDLKTLDAGLEHVVDFGFFSVIARPIFWLLKRFHSLVGNWGWAIVILTIVIRVPFIPLINKGQKSMKKLQMIQPRMQEIKEKYKDDPKRMQQETMEMYRKYKVNPVGGCLPMLLQIPVFFALYKVLLVAIELRNAPWAFWITDLSQKDPLYVLPIVMGISMVVQQKMTPSAGDPKQKKMMMFMPVVFTFLFLNFASGLVLYWLVSNLLSIAQQVYVNRKKEEE